MIPKKIATFTFTVLKLIAKITI